MKLYLARRVLSGIVVLWLVTTLVFIILHAIPGDPAQVIAGELADEKTVRQVRASLGLDRPLHVQYLDLLWGVVRGDMDNSFAYKYDALQVVLERLPSTVELTLVAAVLAIPISIFLGVVSAVRRNSWYDYVAKALTLFGISTPSFWFGIMMIMLFSVQWGLLPAMGQAPEHLPQALLSLVTGDTEPIAKWFRHIIMPVLTLGIFFTALIARMTRTETLENLGRGYVLTAKSKGQSNTGVMVRHVLPNSMIPIITIAGVQVGGLLGGAILTEAVFVWPGMGQLLIDSVFSRDFPVIQASILVYAAIWVAINFLVDLLYLLIDPRITLA